MNCLKHMFSRRLCCSPVSCSVWLWALLGHCSVRWLAVVWVSTIFTVTNVNTTQFPAFYLQLSHSGSKPSSLSLLRFIGFHFPLWEATFIVLIISFSFRACCKVFCFTRPFYPYVRPSLTERYTQNLFSMCKERATGTDNLSLYQCLGLNRPVWKSSLARPAT